MVARTGEEMAITLLRVLPLDLAEQVLGQVDPVVADRLRTAYSADAPPPASEEIDPALAEFFDLLRIADRARRVAATGEPTDATNGTAVVAGEYRPVAGGGGSPKGELGPTAPEETAPASDPIADLQALPSDKLVRVLEGEPPAAISLVLSVLDPVAAGGVMRGLAPELRVQVAMRFSQPGSRNYALIQQLARAIVDKAGRLSDTPAETPEDTRIADLAAMLRVLPRADRVGVFQTMSEKDPELTERVRMKMFRFDDLAKVEDRPLQTLLQQLNLKVIALALKNADDTIAAKVTSNISGRARELLQEEVSLLGSVSTAQVEEARTEVVQLLVKAEEEGVITIEG